MITVFSSESKLKIIRYCPLLELRIPSNGALRDLLTRNASWVSVEVQNSRIAKATFSGNSSKSRRAVVVHATSYLDTN